MTPYPPPRRFTDRDVIARAAGRLAGDAHPVLVEVSTWLADIARNWDDIGGLETEFARNVARAALAGQPDVVPDAEVGR